MRRVCQEVEEHKASGGVSAAVFDKSSKISFPIPGTLKGHSAAKPVMELKSLGQHSTFELSHVLGRRSGKLKTLKVIEVEGVQI